MVQRGRRKNLRVLVLGEVHPEYLFDFGERDPGDKEWLGRLLLAEEMSRGTRRALEHFQADRIYLEARPIIGLLGRAITGARRPNHKRFFFVEGEYDPDRLTSREREVNMARVLKERLLAHPSRSLALVCGAEHAERVGRMLFRNFRRDGRIQVVVRYVPLPPVVEKEFPRWVPASYSA